jgi:hypothetical protein
MGTLRFVGLAILTAVAPIAVLIGSGPAHADPPTGGHGGLISTFREYNEGEKCTCLNLVIPSGRYNALECGGSQDAPDGWRWESAAREPDNAPNPGVRPDGSPCSTP